MQISQDHATQSGWRPEEAGRDPGTGAETQTRNVRVLSIDELRSRLGLRPPERPESGDGELKAAVRPRIVWRQAALAG